MAASRKLNELRQQITDIDRRLVEALEQRFRVSQQVHGILEAEGGQPDLSDRTLLESLQGQGAGVIPEESLRAIFAQIAGVARAIERPTRVAFVGPEGNFCYHMVRTHFAPHATLIDCPTVQEVLDQVRRDRASFGVIAFDSSIEGLLLPAVSALAETDLVLVAERAVEAQLALMNETGNRADVDKIYATAAAHAMSELFVEREFPKATVLDVRSPAEAAQLAAGDHGAACIVPELTGLARGLAVVCENVGDEPGLKYRFGVVGNRPAPRSGNDTTCLLFSLDDAPGTLFQVLSHFAERGINLKKIQSRPVRGATWDYIFYVEVSGHATDRPVVTALEAVKRSTRYLKLLGSFPSQS